MVYWFLKRFQFRRKPLFSPKVECAKTLALDFKIVRLPVDHKYLRYLRYPGHQTTHALKIRTRW